MHRPLFFSGLSQWLSQAFAKPETATPSEKVASISRDNEINSGLVHAFSQGSEPAFRGIYDHYAPAIYRVSLRYFQSGQLAEDLVSEVFTALWYRRATFFEPDEVKLFLFTKAKSIALKYLARMTESRHHEVGP
ncbi:hypothetical protein KK083_09730 [Fulvivirgaceae bacterium PWU4]|uniref:RNA polymerase sigma-70 region 2 domain-containing protein n=1 Tax=Chryseosolibacter histidini TaxID=2782349 RepID=A0AAP2DN82_9BACT|nr:sigma factor [Chryseosolibacter histidini]MBT1697154.1 hypothetical protein [Chryseosolibacter histidini]